METLQNEVLEKFKTYNKIWTKAVSEAVNNEQPIDLSEVQEKGIDLIAEIPQLFSEAKKRIKPGKRGIF